MTGLVLLDKPEGLTSFQAAAALRRIYGVKRVGHTGTLDPMASGVLPVLLGRATRLSSFLLESDKRYTAGVRLGLTTDTYDITGNVVSERPADISDGALESALSRFTGTYDQIPPMYSAIKKDGVRLYDLARKGVSVEREARTVTVKEINLFSRNGADFVIDVLCTKGTYIRSLAFDIGEYLGCGAALTTLRRTAAAGFPVLRCATPEEIEKNPEKHLLPADEAVSHLRELTVSEGQKNRFLNGAVIDADRLTFHDFAGDEIFRIKWNGTFLGLAKYDAESRNICPECIICD